MSTPLERFNQWMASKEPDQFSQSIQTVIAAAEQLGYSVDDVRKACREIRHWLVKNESLAKANKRKWGSFILNWMRPNKFQSKSRRPAPSRFTGETRIKQ